MILSILSLLFNLAISYSVSKDSILRNYNICQRCDLKYSNVETLAYVTPWNEDGYNVASQYWQKFDYIVGAWYELQVETSALDIVNFNITGQVDQNFMRNVTEKGIRSAVFPQFELTRTDISSYQAFIMNETFASSVADAIFSRLSLYNMTGCVLNIIRPGVNILKKSVYKYSEYLRLQIIMINKIVKQLALYNIKAIVVIPETKNDQRPDFNTRDFLHLFWNVHRFIITTNDFSKNTPGPSSPLSWIRKNINYIISKAPIYGIESDSQSYANLKKKLIFTISLFGYEYIPSSAQYKKYQTRVIDGSRFIDIIRRYQPVLSWVDSQAELKIEYTEHSMHIISYYNIQESIIRRLQLANRLGTGIMLWELGQGLPYHYQYI